MRKVQCECNCPDEAHITQVPNRYGYFGAPTRYKTHLEKKCTATVIRDGFSWPCRCSIIYRHVIEIINCIGCGQSYGITPVDVYEVSLTNRNVKEHLDSIIDDMLQVEQDRITAECPGHFENRIIHQ